MINNSVDVENGINNLQVQFQHKFNDQWKSETNFLYSEGFYKSLMWTTFNYLTDSTVTRNMRNQTPETFGNIQLQQNFIGDFTIGKFRNRVVIGLDYNYNYNELYRSVFNFSGVENVLRPTRIINADKIADTSYAVGYSNSYTKAYNYGAYISDVFNITPGLMAMVSLRADRYTTKGTYNIVTGRFTGAYQQNALSPKLGLVYQVVKDKVSVFANYMNGFANLAPATQPDGTILELRPQYANQWEGGVKIDVFANKLNATLNVYSIDVSNSTRTEARTGGNFTVQDGTQLSQGFEFEVIANPISGLNIMSGYAFNENTYKKASAALEGKSVIASPKHVGNIWMSYFLTHGKAKGLGLGVGGNYISESWFEATNVFVLPGYTLLSAALYYDQPKYRISVKGNNLSDEKYWNPGGTPQKPMNVLASVALKF
ncbi:TonB-dependent receptor [Chitinophaga sedimenti]|nr:TonB-dependent receptor [Chitinophaga sedimenti]